MAIPRKYLSDHLGSGFVSKLFDEPFVTICGVPFSKNDLVTKAKTGNFAATRNLERALTEIQTKALTNVDPLELAQIPGVGEVTIFVLLQLQDAARAKPIEFNTTWRTYAKHARETTNGKNGKKKGKTT